MKRYLPVFLTVVCALVIVENLNAQDKSSKVSIKALQLKSSISSDGEDNFEYRLNTWFNGNINSNCVDFDNQPKNTWLDIKAEDQQRVTNGSVSDISAALNFETEGWEEDGCGGDCGYHTSCSGADEGQCGRGLPSVDIIPYNMVPGNYASWPNLNTYNFCGTNYQVKYLITYSPPTPDRPTVKVNGTTLTSGSVLTCDDPLIELTTSIYIRPDFLYHVNYTWEYRINNETYTYSVPNPAYCGDNPSCTGGGGGGPIQQMRQGGKGETIAVEAPIDGQPLPCCYENPYISQTAPRWRSITGTTNANSSNGLKSFNLRSLPGLQNITANARVVFRVTATANGLSSPVSSSSFQVNISPQSPKATTITYDPSCPGNVGTGVVYVSGVTSQFSSYKYILKKGDVASISCHPDTNGSCLSADDISGSASGSSFVVNNVKAQTYTLFLLNNAGTDGFCPRRIDVFTVPSIPDLGVNPIIPLNLTCYGVNEGSIQVSIYNGRPAAVTYDLLNLTTNNSYTQSSNTANASVILDKLDPGSYRLTVSDNCTPAVVRNFDITQPVKVTSSDFQYTNATCADPGNGTARITVTKSSGTFDRSVSSIYTYQLYKDGVLYNELDLNANTYTWTSLPVSADYRAVVKEKGGADCNAATVNFAIAGPDPIGIETPVVSDVTCYGGADGEITIKGKGGTGSYTYELSGPASSSNTTGEFLSLPAGNYTVTVRNTITCSDKYISGVILINQPTEVTAVISKKDISCFGLTDGEITSVVSGGTPGTSGYIYTWETKIGSSWSQLSVTGTSLSALSDGTYRLKVKDQKECLATSNEVVINEPDAVGISGVQVSDIKCFGETGSIAITGTGGTGEYTFGYSLNNGTNFTDFNSSTPLEAGIYQVRIVDANGCSYKDADSYTITAPAEKLSFTETLSDYNGYNISCYGGGNGSAILTASGGNGANYSGYEYALDNGLFQQDAMLTGIYAGDHVLKVKDGRGCIVSKTTTFTQTTAQLTSVLVERKDVTCFGDVTGILEFTGSGGLAPYEYSLDDNAFQGNGRYTGLAVGDHTITIKDKNGCENTGTSTIVTINPKIEITTAVIDVSCYGGNDGSVSTSITGGVPPFQYQWTSSASTASAATGLPTGNYTVTVTDNAGCRMQASTFVSQPLQPLSINLAAIPVCYGRANGSITVTSKGGTEPYTYSIDNGQNYQSTPVFIAGVGSYTVTSRDSKGCTTSSTKDIVLRNDQPEPNFLVASTRNALDTLVIIDVSVPKPDSIYWIFDPQAIVISSDQWSPQLRFLDAGTYFVSMTGYFGGCDYSVTKNMTVTPYDPSIEDEKLPGYKPIQSVMVTPNPSNGTFEVSVKLVKKYNLSIVVYDVLGTRHYDNTWNSIEELKQSITLNNASSGVYLLRVVTESDAQDVRIMINK